ncbi:MAG: LacI family DNA-binding transcriptional regulator [Beutenbergiaceae bacterium]
MKDVAAAAGVSHGTVSHVLNHPERVSPARLQRVREAMEQLGFVRNESARQLRAGRSTTLGLLLIDSWSPFFNQMTEGFEEAVIPLGWNVIVAHSALNSEREARNLDSFEERRHAGNLIMPLNLASLARLERMRERGTGCVLVDQDAWGHPIPSVAVNDRGGGRSVGRHLNAIGRHRILFVGNPAMLSHSAQRLQGLRDGVSADSSISVFEVRKLELEYGLIAGEHILAMAPAQRPEAVFCANDLLGLGVMQRLNTGGVAVPTQIAVVGYDDIGFAAHTSTPLTSVRQPAYAIGQQAGKMLAADIDSDQSGPIEHVVFEPELIIRSSTVP